MSNVRREAFDAAVAAWNAGDLDAYLELYDDSIQLYGYGPEPMGKDAVRAFYRGIWDALSDIELEIHEIVEDDVQLGCRFTMHGTHTGDLAGVAPTGRRVTQPGFTILVFDGARVVRRYSRCSWARCRASEESSAMTARSHGADLLVASDAVRPTSH